MSQVEEYSDLSASEAPVRGFLHRPAAANGDGLVLTHGAGANCNAPLLVALAGAFCAAGMTVLRVNLPFRQLRPQGPPGPGSAERDQQGLRAALASLRKLAPGRSFLGGHSYGGRQATMMAAAEPGLADALLLLSYPLHPPRQPGALRTAHLPKLRTPSLFVHGARDGFGTMEEITAALRLIPARTELIPVAGAGHELLTKKNQDELPKLVVEAFLSFAGKVTG